MKKQKIWTDTIQIRTESVIKNLPMKRTTNDIFHRNSTNNPKICIEPQTPRRFPGGSDSKPSACNAGDTSSIPGSGRSPGEEHGNPLQYSCLENPMDRGAWQATVHGVARVRHNFVTKPPPLNIKLPCDENNLLRCGKNFSRSSPSHFFLTYLQSLIRK